MRKSIICFLGSTVIAFVVFLMGSMSISVANVIGALFSAAYMGLLFTTIFNFISTILES